LTLESLERRALLDGVSLTLQVDVTNLPAALASGPVPVMRATVFVNWTTPNPSGTGSPLHHFTEAQTNTTTGTCQFNSLPISVGTIVSIQVSASGFYSAVSGKTVSYEIDTVSSAMVNGKKVVSPGNPYEYDRDLNIITANQASTISIDAAQSGQVAKALAIYSALTIPLSFAQKIGAKLPSSFWVNYPNDDDGTSFYDSSGNKSGRTGPTINYAANTLDKPDTIAHEVGHLVADANEFANYAGGQHRFVGNIRSAPTGMANTAELAVAFGEGYADYFAVAAKRHGTTSDDLNIRALSSSIDAETPNTKYNDNEIADPAGWGEDSEDSVATMLYALDTVGINPDNTNPDQYLVAPLGSAGLFSFLAANHPANAANFGEELRAAKNLVTNPTAPVNLNKLSATIGTLEEAVNISPSPGDLSSSAGGNMTFSFAVPMVQKWAQNPFGGAGTKNQNTAIFPEKAIRVEVFDASWNQVFTSTAGVTIIPSDRNRNAQGTMAISQTDWSTIKNNGGLYWVVEAGSNRNDWVLASWASYFWSSAKKIDLTKPIRTTSFHGDPTTNNLDLTYDISPTTEGDPGSIPEFTVTFYAAPTGYFSDLYASSPNNALPVGSYVVSDTNVLNATSTNNEFTVQLPGSAIDATALRDAGALGDKYLLARITSNVDGSEMAVVRFQGGAFEAFSSLYPNRAGVFVYGGASLDDQSPDTADFTNTVALASTEGVVSVSGTISDGDASNAFTPEFSLGTYSDIHAWTFDGNSIVDGSQIDDENVEFYVEAGSGNNVITGRAIDNSVIVVGDGDNRIIGGGGTVVTAGDGNNYIVGGTAWNSISAGNGDNYIVAGTASGSENHISLGDGNNTVSIGVGPYFTGPYNDVGFGDGNNTVIVDARTLTPWDIFAGDGNNQVIVTHCADTDVDTSIPLPNTTDTIFAFTTGAYVEIIASNEPGYSLLDSSFGTNGLSLNNGGTVYGLGDIPSGTNITIENGTTFAPQSPVTLGAVTVVSGSIASGSISADSYYFQYATVGADLGGGPVTVEGYAELTGTNTYTGGTTIADAATLAVGENGLGSGTVAFAGESTLVALADLALSSSQPITTPDDSDLSATIDANGYSVAIAGAVSGDGGLTALGGSVELSGTNDYSGGTNIVGGIFKCDTAGSLPDTGPVLINSGATLVAAGANSTAAAWLASGAIDPASSGALGLTSDETAIDLAGYNSLALAAVVDNLVFDGSLTPAGGAYRFADGPYAWTVASLLSGSNSVEIDGNVILTNTSNDYSGGTQINDALAAASDAVFGSGPISFGSAGLLKAIGDLTISRAINTPDDPTASAAIDNNGHNVSLTGTIAGNGGLTLIDGGVGGTVMISGNNSYSGGTVVSGATVQLGSATALGDLSGSLTVVEGGAVKFGQYIVTAGAVYLDGGVIDVGSGALIVATTNFAFVPQGGQGNEYLVNGIGNVEYGDAAVHDALAEGANYVAGFFDGTNGLLSSTAANNPNGNTAVGWIDNVIEFYTDLFRGAAVSASQIIISYAYYGDTDLSGYVDSADYSSMVNYWYQTSGLYSEIYDVPYGVEWIDGNFDLNWIVDTADYGYWADNFYQPALW
jgi:autotransporter-associated beta strand protein